MLHPQATSANGSGGLPFLGLAELMQQLQGPALESVGLACVEDVHAFLTRVCERGGHDDQHCYLAYEGPHPALSLRAAYTAWVEAGEAGPSLKSLPRHGDRSRAFKQVVALVLRTPAREHAWHEQHGPLRWVYWGWRLRHAEPHIYSQPLKPGGQ